MRDLIIKHYIYEHVYMPNSCDNKHTHNDSVLVYVTESLDISLAIHGILFIKEIYLLNILVK